MKVLDPVAELAELRGSKKFLEWKPGLASGASLDLAAEFAPEKHYTPVELSKIFNVSVQTIREIFGKEPGVLKLGRDGTRNRRRYKTLRIPESVVERVHTRLSA